MVDGCVPTSGVRRRGLKAFWYFCLNYFSLKKLFFNLDAIDFNIEGEKADVDSQCLDMTEAQGLPTPRNISVPSPACRRSRRRKYLPREGPLRSATRVAPCHGAGWSHLRLQLASDRESEASAGSGGGQIRWSR